MTLIPFLAIIIEYVLSAAFTIGLTRGIPWQCFFILWAGLLVCLVVCVWSLFNSIRNIRYRNTRVSAIFGTVMSASGITTALGLIVLSIINIMSVISGDGSIIMLGMF